MFCTCVHPCSAPTRHTRLHQENDEISSALSLSLSLFLKAIYKAKAGSLWKVRFSKVMYCLRHSPRKDNIQGALQALDPLVKQIFTEHLGGRDCGGCWEDYTR